MKSLISIIISILFVIFGLGKLFCDKPVINDPETGGAEKYTVTYDYGFTTEKDEYAEGEEVELIYDMIATDTDYTFYVDGKYINPDYSDAKGFVITFIMPDHDVDVTLKKVNSMYIEEPEMPEGVLLESDDEGIIMAAEIYDFMEKDVTLGLYSDNELMFLRYLGKLPEEAGIPKDCIKYPIEVEYYGSIPVNGLLFGKNAYGSIELNLGMEEEERYVSYILLFSHELRFDECTEYLDAIYGAPVSEGEEPYAESNGGAVIWSRFDTGMGSSILVKTGSNNDWIELNLSLD